MKAMYCLLLVALIACKHRDSQQKTSVDTAKNQPPAVVEQKKAKKKKVDPRIDSLLGYMDKDYIRSAVNYTASAVDTGEGAFEMQLYAAYRNFLVSYDGDKYNHLYIVDAPNGATGPRAVSYVVDDNGDGKVDFGKRHSAPDSTPDPYDLFSNYFSREDTGSRFKSYWQKKYELSMDTILSRLESLVRK